MEEVEEFAIADDDTIRDRRASFAAQLLLLGNGNRHRKLVERKPENALRGVVDHMRRDCRVIALERRARHGHSALQAQAHERDFLAHISRPGIETADVVFVILDCLQRHLLR